MLEVIFNKIIGFVSRNFEAVVYFCASILILFLLIHVSLKLRDISFKKVFSKTFRGVMLAGVIGGEAFLIFMLCYAFWLNYFQPRQELDLERNVLGTTTWVHSRLRVYFIDDNTLKSVRLNGRDPEDFYAASEPVKEYHFSPDGKYVAVVTARAIAVVDRITKKSQTIETLNAANSDTQDSPTRKGSLGGVAWAPDSQRFVYEVSRWSKLNSQDQVNVYDVSTGVKKAIHSPTRRISSLYWDRQGRNLYYLKPEFSGKEADPTSYEVKIYRIPLDTLTPEFVSRIPTEDASIPIENLRLRDIELFLEGERYSFGREFKGDYLLSDRGAQLGVDEEDYLFYVGNNWFRQRLFKVPRESRLAAPGKYQYPIEDSVIEDIRWVPGGRYAVMVHKFFGVLVLEPSTAKVGMLVRAGGHVVGWFAGDVR